MMELEELMKLGEETVRMTLGLQVQQISKDDPYRRCHLIEHTLLSGTIIGVPLYEGTNEVALSAQQLQSSTTNTG